MKKIILIFCIVIQVFTMPLLAQEKRKSIPMIIVFDNQFTDGADIVNSKLIITDANKNVKDSITCEYLIGRLLMDMDDYKRLIKFKTDKNRRIYFRFSRSVVKLGEEFPYNIQFLGWQINNDYLVLKIFDVYDKESQEKYFFPQGKVYYSQIMTPGFIDSAPPRR